MSDRAAELRWQFRLLTLDLLVLIARKVCRPGDGDELATIETRVAKLKYSIGTTENV